MHWPYSRPTPLKMTHTPVFLNTPHFSVSLAKHATQNDSRSLRKHSRKAIVALRNRGWTELELQCPSSQNFPSRLAPTRASRDILPRTFFLPPSTPLSSQVRAGTGALAQKLAPRRSPHAPRPSLPPSTHLSPVSHSIRRHEHPNLHNHVIFWPTEPGQVSSSPPRPRQSTCLAISLRNRATTPTQPLDCVHR